MLRDILYYSALFLFHGDDSLVRNDSTTPNLAEAFHEEPMRTTLAFRHCYRLQFIASEFYQVNFIHIPNESESQMNQNEPDWTKVSQSEP